MSAKVDSLQIANNSLYDSGRQYVYSGLIFFIRFLWNLILSLLTKKEGVQVVIDNLGTVQSLVTNGTGPIPSFLFSTLKSFLNNTRKGV
jgi:hypothetical protein